MSDKKILLDINGVSNSEHTGTKGPEFQKTFVDCAVLSECSYYFGESWATGIDIVIENPADSGVDVILATYVINNFDADNLQFETKENTDLGTLEGARTLQTLNNNATGSTKTANFNLYTATYGSESGTGKLNVKVLGTNNSRGGLGNTTIKKVLPGNCLVLSLQSEATTPSPDFSVLLNFIEQGR